MVGNDIKLIHDNPLKKATLFGFDNISNTFLKAIMSAPLDSPFNMCINGSWGSGKTTLLRSIEQKILNSPKTKDENGHTISFIPLWFQPWKLSKEIEVLNVLVNLVLRHIESDAGFLANAYIEVNRKDVLRIVSERFLKVKPDQASSYFQWDTRLKGSFFEIEDLFNRIARAYLFDNEVTRRFVVFVDDLDRCRPQRVVEVLESVKLFFDMPGFIFLFAMDKNQIEVALNNLYPSLGLSGSKTYLEKMFQLIFALPQKEIDSLILFVEANFIKLGFDIEDRRLMESLVETFGRNLRNLKLFINKFNFHKHLIKSENTYIDDEVLSKWLYIETKLPQTLKIVMRRKSLGLIFALEFLAKGACLSNIGIYNDYIRSFGYEELQYIPLIICSLLPPDENNKYPVDKRLNASQKEVVNSLRLEDGVSSCLSFLHFGKTNLREQDLAMLAYLTLNKEIGISRLEEEAESKEFRRRIDHDTVLSGTDWNKIGRRYYDKEEYRASFYCYLMALLTNFDSAKFWIDLANPLRKIGRFKAASALYKIAHTIDSTYSYLYSKLSYMYDLDLNDVNMGTLLYRKALSAGSRNTTIFYNLSHNLEKQGDITRAFYHALKAFMIKPNDSDYQQRAARYASLAGKDELDFKDWNDILSAELETAKRENLLPYHLTESEEKEINDMINSYPDLSEISDDLLII